MGILGSFWNDILGHSIFCFYSSLLFFLLTDDPAPSTFGSFFTSPLGFLFRPRTLGVSGVLLPTKNQQSLIRQPHASRFLLSPRETIPHYANPTVQL